MPDESNLTAPIRVLLADDHDILRYGLKMLLGLQPDMQVVGEARTGQEALEMAQELQPDVVVMDITMPEMDGLQACRIMRSLQPATQVLFLTMHESMAIREVAHGGAFLYPGLAKALIRAYVADVAVTTPTSRREERGKTSSIAQELQALTPREIEVLKLVAEGRTNQEIADRLVLSIKTIQAHRANVMEKLGLHDITKLVRFAIRHGLIPLAEDEI